MVMQAQVQAAIPKGDWQHQAAGWGIRTIPETGQASCERPRDREYSGKNQPLPVQFLEKEGV